MYINTRLCGSSYSRVKQLTHTFMIKRWYHHIYSMILPLPLYMDIWKYIYSISSTVSLLSNHIKGIEVEWLLHWNALIQHMLSPTVCHENEVQLYNVSTCPLLPLLNEFASHAPMDHVNVILFAWHDSKNKIINRNLICQHGSEQKNAMDSNNNGDRLHNAPEVWFIQEHCLFT